MMRMIASELSGDRGVLDGANDLEVDGGNTTIIGAADIQSSDGYDSASEFLHNHRFCKCNPW